VEERVKTKLKARKSLKWRDFSNKGSTKISVEALVVPPAKKNYLQNDSPEAPLLAA
jgi:hypothetical protein